MTTFYRIHPDTGQLEQRANIASVDSSAYYRDGWVTSPPATPPAIAPPSPTLLPTYEPPADPIPPAKPGLLPSVPPIEARLAELQELATDWRKIKPVAESAGITEKPEDGWDAAVLPILVAEYGQAAVDDLDE